MPEFAKRLYATPTGQEIKIRLALPDDAEAVLAYMHDNLPEVTPYICTTPEEFTLTLEEERAFLAGQDPTKGSLYTIAEIDGRVIGSLNISCFSRSRLGHVSLLGMTLRKDFRGVGLGSAMLKAVVEWTERHPVTEMLQLEVYADNERAQRLYRRFGFVEAGRIPRRMKFGPGQYKDAVIMYREVTTRKADRAGNTGVEIKVDDTVTLRLASLEYAEEVFTLVERNRAYISPWMSWVEATKSMEDIKRVKRESIKKYAERSQLAVHIFENERIVGAVGLHDLNNPNGSAELGYWLDEAEQGRGLVTRSAKALLDYAFAEYGLHRVYLTADAQNARSIAVAERLGMRREGEMKQDVKMPGIGYRDSVLYAVLADAWKGKTL
ncbi:MAG: GNAT family N-acetyltransferase [Planctomycetota bacterium]